MFVNLVRCIIVFLGGGAYRFLVILLIGFFTLVIGFTYSLIIKGDNLSVGEASAVIGIISIYAVGVLLYSYLIWLGIWKKVWDCAIRAIDEFQK
jgi:hypothetical protein